MSVKAKGWDDGARPWGQPGFDCDCEAYLRYCNPDHPFCTYWGEMMEATDDYMVDQFDDAALAALPGDGPGRAGGGEA